MVAVYSILPDVGCQILEPDERGKFIWAFAGMPIGDQWRSVRMYIPNPLLPKPDIWCVGGAPVFAFEQSARWHLQTFLDKAGEQLNLRFQRRALTVLNVTNVMNCLDLRRSTMSPYFDGVVDRYEFHVNRLDNTVFKLPETRYSRTYCVEGLTADGDEFKTLYEKHGLKGLRFERVWTDERPKKAKPTAKKKAKPAAKAKPK